MFVSSLVFIRIGTFCSNGVYVFVYMRRLVHNAKSGRGSRSHLVTNYATLDCFCRALPGDFFGMIMRNVTVIMAIPQSDAFVPVV